MNLAQELNIKATNIKKLRQLGYDYNNIDKINTFVNFTKRVMERNASEGKFTAHINIMKCGLTAEEADIAYKKLQELGFKTRKDWLTGPRVIVSCK